MTPRGRAGVRARPRVAVACQGGGSHTAFTAGVLERLVADDRHQLVALSGTSGGAIDALLAWSGLLAGGPEESGRRLRGFWRDMSARGWPERLANAVALGALRVVGTTVAPEVSPYYVPALDAASARLRAVLESHVDFAAIPDLAAAAGADMPALLIGAVEVRSGRFAVFRNEWDAGAGRAVLDVSPEAVLASAAIPTIFRAVPMAEGDYWDGLFSQNPPVRDLPETGPDEIWVVRINPMGRAATPMSVADIRDRRNELAGNLSLNQELHFINKVNEWLDAGALVDQKYRPITVRELELATDAVLDSESKLDRDPDFLAHLMELGRAQAAAFLEAPPAPAAR